MEIIVIVPRYVRAEHDTRGRVELFLPYDPVDRGYIEVWHPSEGHNQASWDYYLGTRAPWDCKPEADRLIEQYTALCAELAEGSYEVRVRQRLPNDWREHAWES